MQGEDRDTSNPRVAPDNAPAARARRVLLLVTVNLLVLALLVGGLEAAARALLPAFASPTLHLVLQQYAQLARGDTASFRFVPDAALAYRLRPNFTLCTPDSRCTRHNDAGFRADAPFPPKSPGVVRIVCLGGSTTYGVGVVDSGDTYPAALERLLNGDLRPPGWAAVEVFNLGVGGYTSKEVLGNLERHGLPLEPDIVLIHSGVNDVAPRFYPNFRADYSHFRKTMEPLPDPGMVGLFYRSHLVIVIGYTFGRVAPLTLQARTQYPLPPAKAAVANFRKNDASAYRANLVAMVERAQAAGVRPWIITQAHQFLPAFAAPTEELRMLDAAYEQGMIQHNAVMRDVARETGAGLVDLEESMPPNRVYFHDPIHMTATGNIVKARSIAESLRAEPR